MKNSPWINPVTICLAVCAGLFVYLGIQFGESFGTILQQVFLPYLLDISGGVGRQGALIFRGVALVLQVGVVGFVLLRGLAKEDTTRAALSTFGIIWVIAYFFTVGAGYVLPRLH